MWPAGGDVEGKLALLKRDLAEIRYPGVFDDAGARLGRPNALLPVIAFALHRHSRHVAAAAADARLVGRRGKRYVEGVFALARDVFGMRIGMKSAQFLAEGYAERKLMLTHQLIAAIRSHHSTAVRKARLGVLDRAQVRAGPPVQPQEAAKTANGRGQGGETQGAAAVSVATAEPQTSPAARPTARSEGSRTPEYQPRPLHPAALGAATSPGAPPRFAAFVSPLLRFGLAEEDSPDATPCTSAPGSPEWVPPAPASAPAPATAALLPLELVREVRGVQDRLDRLEHRVQGASERVAAAHASLDAHLRLVEGRVLALEGALLRSRGHNVTKSPPWAAEVPPGRPGSGHGGSGALAPRRQQGAPERGWDGSNACFNPLFAQQKSPPQLEEGGSPPGPAGSGCSSRASSATAGGGAGAGLGLAGAGEHPVTASWKGTRSPPGGAQAVLQSLRARVAEAAAAVEEARGALRPSRT